jgi:hypothetical protein
MVKEEGQSAVTNDIRKALVGKVFEYGTDLQHLLYKKNQWKEQDQKFLQYKQR